MYSIQNIAAILDGELISGNSQATDIDNLLIDSRKINSPKNSLFIALLSDRNDGHQYIQQCVDKSVYNFLISDAGVAKQFPSANFVVVDNTLLSLQKLVKYHKHQHQVNTIGITGSNGKTIIKEWLFELLNEDYFIAKSPKSYNSQIGVPLSVWQLQNKHDLAIFEAGISVPNEMENIAPIIDCNIGIFTNIGAAHDEGFQSTDEKIAEKMKLFETAKTIIYCRDHTEIDAAMYTLNNDKLLTWSFNKSATLQITKKEISTYHNTKLTATYQGNQIKIKIPFRDDAYVENAIHCWVCLLYLKVPNEVIQKRMLALKPLAMRLEMKAGINQCSLINDSYNSDLNSLKIALDFLTQQAGNQEKILFLSDILQSGISTEILYQKIGNLIVENNISQVVGIGNEVVKLFDYLPDSIVQNHYPTTTEFLQKITTHQFSNAFILIKGARAFELEKVTAFLSEKVHQTALEINLNALTHNYQFFKSNLNASTKMMVMIKAAAYGAGSAEVARILEYNGVDYFAIAYPDEGVTLRKAGIKTPMMVLNADAFSFDTLIRYQLEPEIYSFRQLDQLLDFLNNKNIATFGIHLKIDTGMHRLGFEAKDLPILIEKLTANSTLKVLSIFSHLAASEDKNEDTFSNKQVEIFEKLYNQIVVEIGYKPIRHLLNSPGIIRFPQYQMDMVRLGIGLYGLDMSQMVEDQLEIVHTLKATISQIREVPPGETIGYNRKEAPSSTLKIATISIGYADGLPRLAGNRNYQVAIQNKLFQIIGNVCMDMCMIDITGKDGINEGDEVIIFGKKPSVKILSKVAQTIPYEIFTNISERVKRVYYLE